MSSSTLFQLGAYLQLLALRHDKQEFLQKYGATIKPIASINDFADLPSYGVYVGRMKCIPYKVPAGLEASFDWDMLLRIACASVSCNTELHWDPVGKEVELIISVKGGDENEQYTLVKKLHELHPFQITRLFEIFAEEIMGIELLTTEDQESHAIAMEEQLGRLRKNNDMVQRMNKHIVMGKLAP